MRSFFHFAIFSNLFIAACAMVMTWHTMQLFPVAGQQADLLWFVFFATITSYSFHWWLTPADGASASTRIQWLRRNRWVHLVLFFVGLSGVTWKVIALSDHLIWIAGGAVITFLYSAPMIPHPLFHQLRKIAVGKTIVLAFAWTYVTAAMPLLLAGQAFTTSGLIYFTAKYFFLYAICIVFDYRDREYDRSIGIRSLITWLSPLGVRLLFWLSLATALVFSLSLTFTGVDRADIFTLVLPTCIMGLLFSHALHNHEDIFYYFFLDGLMALPAILGAALQLL